jgi:hypothetical protein
LSRCGDWNLVATSWYSKIFFLKIEC